MRSVETLGDLQRAFEKAVSYPTRLPRELYDRAKREGFNMTGYAYELPLEPMPNPYDADSWVHSKFAPSDKPKWSCPGQHKQIKNCNGGGTCMPGKGGKCTACADDD